MNIKLHLPERMIKELLEAQDNTLAMYAPNDVWDVHVTPKPIHAS